jgi:hypothetical protein
VGAGSIAGLDSFDDFLTLGRGSQVSNHEQVNPTARIQILPAWGPSKTSISLFLNAEIPTSNIQQRRPFDLQGWTNPPFRGRGFARVRFFSKPLDNVGARQKS